MKRSYSDANRPLSTLPKMLLGDGQTLKSVLQGSHKLKVLTVTDISKPAHKPVDDIEEPEEEDAALENKLSKCNARMVQLDLKDSENKRIRAIETEHIDLLNEVKPFCIISLNGPVEVRCGNLMLTKKHVMKVELGSKEEDDFKDEGPSLKETPVPPQPQTIQVSAIPVTSTTPALTTACSNQTPEVKMTKDKIELVNLADDNWDEDWDEEDDECIILD